MTNLLPYTHFRITILCNYKYYCIFLNNNLTMRDVKFYYGHTIRSLGSRFQRKSIHVNTALL